MYTTCWGINDRVVGRRWVQGTRTSNWQIELPVHRHPETTFSFPRSSSRAVLRKGGGGERESLVRSRLSSPSCLSSLYVYVIVWDPFWNSFDGCKCDEPLFSWSMKERIFLRYSTRVVSRLMVPLWWIDGWLMTMARWFWKKNYRFALPLRTVEKIEEESTMDIFPSIEKGIKNSRRKISRRYS